MTKRIADEVYYLTTDMDNFEAARDLALAVGVNLQLLFPRDLPLPADALALVVDLDCLCLDARGRHEFVRRFDLIPTASSRQSGGRFRNSVGKPNCPNEHVTDSVTTPSKTA